MLANYRDELELELTINRAISREVLTSEYSAVLLVDGMIGECIGHYQSITPPSTARTATTVLANRAHSDLLSGWQLVESGAYGPAAVMIRAVYEDWLSMVYFKHYPKDLSSWWDSGQWKEHDRELDFGRLKARLIQDGHLQESERNTYATLSSMAHPSATSAMTAIRPPGRGKPDGPHLRFVPRFYFTAARHSSRLLLILGLRVVRHFEAETGMGLPDSPIGSDSNFLEVVTEMKEKLGLDEAELQSNPLPYYGIGRRRAR